MRGSGYGLLVIGIIVAILGLVNHYVLKANPVAHTSSIIIGVGVVLAVIGLAMSFMGGRKA
jgi:predicted tellurium resistance membrane protein TerC